MSLPIPADVIRLLSLYLSPRDIIHVGRTCRALAEKMLRGVAGGDDKAVATLWRQYVANCVVSDVPVRGVAGDAYFWQRMAFEKKRDLVRWMLQERHLTHRLAQPQSSKEFLRFFVRIDTTGQKPQRDLLGNVIPNQFEEVKLPSVLLCQPQQVSASGFDMETSMGTSRPGWLTLSFCPAGKTGQKVLWWEDESTFQSTMEIYAVDRQRMPPKIVLKSDQANIPVSWKFICRENLTRSLCREAGKLAHNDENYFFTNGEGRSYNYNSNHGNFRNMGEHHSRYGFASNSGNGNGDKLRVREYLDVFSFQGLEVSMDLRGLYELFCRV